MAVGYKSKLNGAFSQPVDLDDVYVRKEYFDTGNLWAWGVNSGGQLGDNTTVSKSSPVQVTGGGTNWKQASIGQFVSGAIKSDGTLWVAGTGYNNFFTQPFSGTDWKQISCDYNGFMALKTDGTLWGWGDNDRGQLGNNTVTFNNSPVQTVAGGTNWKQISTSANKTRAAIKTDGTLWMWGYNYAGAVGDNTTVDKSSPVQTVAGGTNWKQVACGAFHTLAIKTDGTLWTWGYNADGALGDGTNVSKSSPVQTVAGGTNWKKIAEHGYGIGCAIKTDGTLWLWGNGSNGQLGTGVSQVVSSPVQTITGGNNWKEIAPGVNFMAAIKTDGTLWAWGLNYYGNIGDGTTVTRLSPVQTVAGGTNWKQLSSGWDCAMALKG